MKKLLLVLLLPLASYCMNAPQPELVFDGPHLSYNHMDYDINLQENNEYGWVVGRITFRYLDDQTAKIVLFSVDKKIQHKGYGQQLFQKCVSELLAKNIKRLNWTVHALDGFDQELLYTVYPRIVKKLENSSAYQLSTLKNVGKKKNKTRMILEFKK